MAIVPFVKGPSVQERPVGTPYSNIKYTPEDFGAGAADTIGQVGNLAQKIAGEEMDRADRFKTAEADFQLGKAINDRLWNRDSGFLLQQGENALDLDPVYADIEKTRETITKNLASNRQRQMFTERARSRVEQARESMERHSGQQRQTLYKNVADGQMQLALDSAEFDYQDPALVNSAVQKVIVEPDGTSGVLPRYLKDVLGLPPEKVTAMVDDFKATAYERAIEQNLANNDAEGAMRFLDAVRGSLGKRSAKLEKRVQAAYGAVQDEKQSMEIEGAATIPLEQRTKPEFSWVDEDTANTLVEALPAGPRKDAIRKRVDERLKDAKQRKLQAGRSMLGQALSIYYTNGYRLTDARLADIKTQMLDDKNGWSDLWGKLEREHDERQNKTRQAVDRTGRDALQEFEAMADQEQAELDIDSAYTGTANKYWRDQMREKQKGAKKRVQDGSAIKVGEFEKFIDSSIRDSQWGKSKTDRSEFMAKMKRWYFDFQKDHNGKEPSYGEASKQVNENIRTIVVPRAIIPDKEIPAFKATPEEKEKASGEKQAPKTDKRTRALQLRGQGLTAAQAAEVLNKEGY